MMQAALMLLLLQHAHHQLLTGVPIFQRPLATAGEDQGGLESTL
jgi:hypothetical protein